MFYKDFYVKDFSIEKFYNCIHEFKNNNNLKLCNIITDENSSYYFERYKCIIYKFYNDTIDDISIKYTHDKSLGMKEYDKIMIELDGKNTTGHMFDEFYESLLEVAKKFFEFKLEKDFRDTLTL